MNGWWTLLTKEGVPAMEIMQSKRVLWSMLLFSIMAMLAIVFLVAQAEEKDEPGEKESRAVLTAEQVIASVKTAVAAKPGGVREVEAENEGEKLVCEVEIVAPDGKTYEIEVDVKTNSVIEVEEDD
jgi:ABC-type Na+ efflux pump permease subunit